jgi:hypothetical protein
MNQDVKGLLQNLREAIHEALAESADISAAMAALEQAGHCPAFKVDIDMPESDASGERIDPVEFDENFLRSLGISSGL